MFASQTLSILTDAIGDSRFSLAVRIAALSGLVRGFSGFGSALIYMPLISAVYSPLLAPPTLLLIDTTCSLPFALWAMPQCNWTEVTPVSIAGALALPLGVAALLYVEPPPRGIGVLAGFGAGAVQIGAPPLLVYWPGGQNSAVTVRANIMVYFIMHGTLSMLAYFYGALFTAQAIALSLLLGVPFAALMAVGARLFHGASDTVYRRSRMSSSPGRD